MKAIFSHLSNYEWGQKYNYKILAAYANFWAQKNGFETIFFGDETSLKDFKNIKYDHTYKMPHNLRKNFPRQFWSVGKLISLSLMNEPCIHIDNDLFLTKPIPDVFLKNDIYCFHNELFVDFEKIENSFEIRPSQTLGFPVISYNCGVIGGQDIITIQNSINILFDFIFNNLDYLEKFNLTNKDQNLSVVMEQIWLYQIIKSFNKQINELIQPKNWQKSFESQTVKTGYVHLMTDNKLKFIDLIEKALIKKNISY